ncbi:MAG: hypothetical protein HKN40_10755 [Winogradskyella sp.]|uniref:hypothetical protein n=1 Tax=Winogradskyella sp. TaxID=1883156 RepID=UPI0018485E0F|nr:hypothetical protein [Winogradskyella sp.]
MKKASIWYSGVLVLAFLVFTSASKLQDKQVMIATYDGHEDYGYNFISIDEDDEAFTITFQEINEDLLKTFDLKSDKLIGAKFKLTYTSKIIVETDEDGYEDETEVNTLIGLSKL